MSNTVSQGFKSTLLQYIGLAIGFVAQIFLYSVYQNEYGLVQVLISIASILTPFAVFGSMQLAVRFFPKVGGKLAPENGFLTFLLALTSAGIFFYLLISPILQDWLLQWFEEKTKEEYKPYLNYAPILVVLIAYLKVLSFYTVNFKRIVVPLFFEQFLLKLTLPSLILAFSVGLLTIQGIVTGLIINYIFALLGLIGYLFYLGKFKLPKIQPIVKQYYREMASYSAYGVAGMVGASLAFGVDTLFVGAYLGLDAVAIYSIVRFMSEVIAKPYSNIRNVMSPQISKAWKENTPEAIDKPYKSSSINLLFLSMYIFGGLLVCFEPVTELTKHGEDLLVAFPALILLGLSRVVDSSTSINEHIISYSTKYRFNLIAILCLAVINIIMNWCLAPILGMTGVALSTLISITLYNLAKLVFAGRQFGLWPFTKKSLEVFIVLTPLILLVYFIPYVNIWWLDILIKGGLFTVLVFVYAFFFPPSVEIAKGIKVALSKVGIPYNT